MSKSEIALIKKLYEQVKCLRKEIEELKDLVRGYHYTRFPDDTPHIYPSRPIEPLRPYFDNPIKRSPQGPWMSDKVYSKMDTNDIDNKKN